MWGPAPGNPVLRFCDLQTCLILYENDATFDQGNQNGLWQGNLLPFKCECKMGFWAEATGLASIRHICCFSSLRPRCDFGQRQLDRPPSGISAAFDTFEQDWVFSKGNWIGLHPAYLLPLTHSSKIGSSTKATNMAPDRHICCLWHIQARLGLQQRQLKWHPTDKLAAFDLLSKISEPRQVSRARLEL